jgi:hypothetical protein
MRLYGHRNLIWKGGDREVAVINSALKPVLNEGVILVQSRFVLLKELQEMGNHHLYFRLALIYSGFIVAVGYPDSLSC